MEEDIVADNISNAFVQGCERVYLVDNASPDGTVDAARAAGAILARSYKTDHYDERLRLQLMNDVVKEVSRAEGDRYIWWLFLDADEFPHGPGGMTLGTYLRTLDERFRIVGTRYFNHYPSVAPHHRPGRHPIESQPLCEELVYPMCAAGHRKHPLQRFDRDGPPLECGRGFHLASCTEPLYEPADPAFLHHFPFREERQTRARLEALWRKNTNGVSRAIESDDATGHMLARAHSLDAVYAQDWHGIENFIVSPPTRGVIVTPWSEIVAPDHQHVLGWQPISRAWKYDELDGFAYGEDTTFRKAIAFLDGHGLIEDWGCGFARARQFVRASQYVGVDGSSRSADINADLAVYSSNVDCILIRHVLEHNHQWQRILGNAISSFRKRMVLVIFTPFADATRQIASSTAVTSTPVPDISFRKEDLTASFSNCRYIEESLRTDTQYGIEHLFYLEK